MQPPAAAATVLCGRFTQAERIEHLKEEDEGRDVGALGEAFAAQLHHERCQHQALALGMRDQPADGFGRMHDVGVGQQQIIRRLAARSSRHRCPASAPTASRSIPPASRGCAPRATARSASRGRAGDLGGAIAHCRRRPRRPSIDRHNPAEAASRCCHRCSRPRCAPAPPPPRAAIPAAPPAPNRRARRSAKRPRGPKADRARPARAIEATTITRAQSLRSTPQTPPAPGRPSRFPKNNSTYSMNWARKSLDGRGALARLSSRARSG